MEELSAFGNLCDTGVSNIIIYKFNPYTSMYSHLHFFESKAGKVRVEFVDSLKRSDYEGYFNPGGGGIGVVHLNHALRKLQRAELPDFEKVKKRILSLPFDTAAGSHDIVLGITFYENSKPHHMQFALDNEIEMKALFMDLRKLFYLLRKG